MTVRCKLLKLKIKTLTNIVIFFTLIRIASSNYESYINNKYTLNRSKRQAGTCGTSCNDFQETDQLFIFERGNLVVNYGKDSKGCKTADISCKGTGPAEAMTMTLLFTVDGISGEFKELGLTDPTAIPEEITTQLQCTANGSWILDGLAYSNVLSCESLYILDCQQLTQVNIEDTNALLPFPHSNSIKGTTQLSTNANDIGEEIQSVEICKASIKTNYVAILAETTEGQYIVVANEVSYTYAEFVCHKGQLTSNENIPGSFTGNFICQEYEPVTDCTPLDVKQISISDTSLSVPSEINYQYEINQGSMEKKEIVLSTGFKDIQITCQGIDTTKYVIFAVKSTDDQNTNIQSGQYAHSALISCKNNTWVTVTGAEVTGEIVCDEIKKIEEITTALVDVTTTEACIKCPDPNIGSVVTEGYIKADLNITVTNDLTYNCDVLILSCTSKNGNNNVALLATRQDGTKLDLKYGPYNNQVKVYCDQTGTYKSEAVGGTELTGEFVCEEPSLIATTSSLETTDNNLCNKCKTIEEGVPITSGANAGIFSFTETTDSSGCLVLTLSCKANNENDISALLVQKLDNTYHMLQRGTHEIEGQMICNNDKQWEDKNKVLLLETVVCEQYNVQKTEEVTTVKSTVPTTEKDLTTTEESTLKYTMSSKLTTVVSTSNDIATETSTDSSTVIVSTLTPELSEIVTFTDVFKTSEELSTMLTSTLATTTSENISEIVISTLVTTTSEELTTIVTSIPTTSEDITTIETSTLAPTTSEELTTIETSIPTTSEELTTIETSIPTTSEDITPIETSTPVPTTSEELTTIVNSTPGPTTFEVITTIETSTLAPTTSEELTTIVTSIPTTSEELTTIVNSTPGPTTFEVITTIETSTLAPTTSEELTTIETSIPTTSKELTTIETSIPTTSEELTTIETSIPTTSEELTTIVTSIPTTSEELTTIVTSIPTTSEDITPIETSTPVPTTSEELTTIVNSTPGPTTFEVITTIETSTLAPTTSEELTTIVTSIPTTSEELTTIETSTLAPTTSEELTTIETSTLASTTSEELTTIVTSIPTTSEELTTIVNSTPVPTTSEDITTIETSTLAPTTSEELTTIETSTLAPTTSEELTTIVTSIPTTSEELTTIVTSIPTTSEDITPIETSTPVPTTSEELTTIVNSTPGPTTFEVITTIETSTLAPTTSEELTTIVTSIPTTSEELTTIETSTLAPTTSEELTTIETSTLASTTSEELTTIVTSIPTTSEELTTIVNSTPVPTTSEDITTIETSTLAPTTSEELTTIETSTLAPTTSEELTTIVTSIQTTSEVITTIETSTLAPTTSEELTTIETSIPTTSKELTTIETSIPTTSEELTTIETSTPTTSEELTTIVTSIPTTSEDITTIVTSIPTTSEELTTIINSTPVPTTSEDITTIETSTLAPTTSEELTTIETSIPTTSEELTTIVTSIPTTSEELTTIVTSIPTTSEELTTIVTSIPITSEELTTIETSIPTTSEELTTIETSIPTTSEELTTIVTSIPTTSEELTTIVTSIPTTSEDITTIETSTLAPTTSEELTTIVNSTPGPTTSEDITTIETSTLAPTTSEELTTIETSTPVPTTSKELTTIETSIPTTSEELTTIETSTPTTSEELTTIVTSIPTTSEDITTIVTSIPTTSEELTTIINSTPVPTTSEDITTIETSTLAPTTSEELTTIETSIPTTSEELTTIVTSIPTTSEELTTIVTSIPTTSEELTTIVTSIPITSEELTTIVTSIPTTSEDITTIETSTLAPTTSEELTTIETSIPTTSEELTTIETSTPTTSEELTTIVTSIPTTSEDITTIETSTLAPTTSEELTTIVTSIPTTSEETTSISPLCDVKNGVWSSWKTISECSDTCGSCGHTIKRRTCLSLQFNIPCLGDSEKVDRCNHKPCTFPRLSCCHGLKATVINKEIVCDSLPADEKAVLPSSCCPPGGIWGNWENWSSCNGNSCESCGKSTRTRVCLTDSNKCPCQGDSSETKSCKYIGSWSEWSETIPCTDDCGQCGVRTLERKCLTTGTCACKGASKKTEICGFSPCVFPRDSCCNGIATVLSKQILCGPLPEPTIEEEPPCVSCCVVGGVWSEWVSEPCTDTCGSCGKQKKTRTCLSSPQCPCTGDSARSDPCNIEPCTFPRDSCCNGLSAMASTDGTNKIICGPQPIIFDPKPSTVCMPACCPKYGVWSEWSSQTSCDDTCGTSKRKQIRTCLSEGNGCPCVGSYTKEEYCSTIPCVFPRQSCNEGYKAMVINSNITCGPLPSLEVEEKKATLECNSMCCPKYGTWSEWQITKPCEDVCGSCSTETRSRTCLNEDECPCVGDKTQTYVCKTNPCVFPRDSCCGNYKAMVVNNELICGPLENIKEENPFVNSCDNTCCPNGGMWTDWYDVTVCGDTCGSYSNVTQSRLCISEYFGCSCTGNSERTIPCNTQPCTFPRDSCSPGLKAGVYDGKIQCGPLNLPAAEIIQKTTCCPPDGHGIWGKWGEWSKCDANSCGGCNEKKRTRICESEKYGCPCTGTNEETEYCSQQPCIDYVGKKVCCSPFSKSIGPTKDIICIVGGTLSCPEEGQWSEWSSGTCTDTCGMCGIIKKERTCLTTSQGCDCTGNNVLNTTQACGELVCPYPRSLCCEGYSRKIVNKKFVCAK